jgi:Fe-S cluster biogenesis protein NfuA
MVCGRAFSYIRAGLISFACLGLASSGLSGASPAANGDAAWKEAGADESLRQAFERATYSLKESGHGTWRGANAAQRLTLEFDGREARLVHPNGSVSFYLTGYGYGQRLREPALATLAGNGNRVEYRRADLTEWYVNGSQGLEQGFTLAQRPGTGNEGEPLVIAVAVSGGLLPVRTADDGAVLFESDKGVVLRYAGLRAVDARGRVLPSRLEARNGEVRLIVEDRQAEYPLMVDPTWTQQQELTASDGAVADDFGGSVSVSGNTAVIGAQGKSIGRGAAYVFVRSGGVWTQQQELTASDGMVSAYFGASVSVSGDTAVIGAYDNNFDQGAVYVFVRGGGVWSQQQKLTASDGAANDQFGNSVSVSGDTAVVGALSKNAFQGAAYVFVRSGGVWSQQQKLTAPDGGVAGDWFGQSVSVSGDTAVIGAAGKNSNQGAAYVFVRSGGAWSEQQKLAASDGAAGAYFGESASVSGDTAVVGAFFENVRQGAAYVFVRSSGIWSQQQELTASDAAGGDEFGWSVSLGADTAVVGAPAKKSSQGAAYVFVRSGGVWTQQQEFTAYDGVSGDQFGSSVSMSGDTAMIGAWARSSDQGAAYAFVHPKLGTSSLLVGSAAGASSVVLSYDGAWTATANDSFLHVSSGSASGTGSAVVVFTYDAFTGTGTRTGTLTIAGLTVTVTQAGANYLGPGPVVTLVPRDIDGPLGVAVDGSGNLYIAEVDGRLNKWSAATQQLTTLMTSDSAPLDGAAVDGSGNVYIADQGGNAIKEWNATTQQVTSLVSSGLLFPTGVAVDRFGNVYIADSGDEAIKEWSAATQQVTTLESSGTAFWLGVAVDGSGNVYCSEVGYGSIEERNATTQQITTLASTGPSEQWGVAVDGSGNVYFSLRAGTVQKWSAATQQVNTLVSSGLYQPSGVAVDASGNVYIADSDNNAIKEIPYAFVGPASFTEPPSAGSDSLLPVLPATTNLTGVFAPTSDQSWLTIGSIANGVIGFSFTANTSSARTAHITVLGHQITVTQNGLSAQTITFGALSNQAVNAAPFAVAATASSGLAVSFASTTPAACTVSGATVTLVAVGTCTVQATQAGNAYYTAAPPVNQSFQVTSGVPAVISAFSGTGQNATVGKAFSSPLQALVTDSGGSAVPNATVTFTAPSSGASVTFGNGLATYTTTTNNSGTATSWTFVANGTTGAYSVTAAVTGVSAVASFSLTNLIPPVLSIAKTHSGNFTQGQTNAVYTVTVSNQAGVAPTSGAVLVTENVPTGLTLLSMAGTGWACSTSGSTCTRVDSLSAGASYPPITVTVNVASNAPATVTNAVTVSGGGDSNTHIAADATAILSPVTLPTGALSYWSADDTATDSISGNNGSLVNGATYAAGKRNDAFSLNGVNSYVQVNGGASISGARSVSMWVYARASASALGMPLLTGGVAGAGDFFGILNGQPYIDHWNFPAYRCNLSLTSNAWNHVAMTYDGSTVQFYVNGVAATPVSGNLYDYAVGTYRIGGNVIGGSTTAASFNGLLDEIVLYPRVLTANEVQTLAALSTSPSTPTTPTAPPALSIAKTHSGNFTQGQTYAVYTVFVSNQAGVLPTSGTVSVTESVPTGLTLVSMAGTGWTCPSAGTTCTRGDSLGAGASYPPITVTVNVASNAAATVTNSVSVSGGGDSNTHIATDATTILSSTASPVTAPPGALSYWSADDTTTDSISGNNGTLVNGATYAAGKLNDAFSLNGVNSYVQVNGNASISGARSVSMWVYARTSTSALGMPLLTGGAAGAGDFFGILNGQPYIDHWNFPAYRCNLTLTSNAWNHVAMVYDGSTVQFYVNGVAATLVSGNLYDYTVGTYRIGGNTIGGSTTAASFNGLLDEIRLYPRVLTASEVQALASLSTTTTPTAPPALSIAKTHSGNFTQGQTNAVYTVTVSNQAGVLPTSGTVIATENVPTGLTLVSMAGAGWICPASGTTCTRGDSLSAGASYPAITVTVNVASNAAATVTNSVTVSGGGDSNMHIATDATTIVSTTTPTAPPALSIAKTHSGNFTQGQTNAVYTVTVSNQAGVLPTSGTVIATENVPTGLTLVSMSGTGWICPASGTTCTRGDSLSAGASYPAITVTVNVASNAPATVTNAVTVSGGGDSNTHIAADTTTIVSPVTENAPPGALSYWSADDTTTDSISGNNGTLVNGATYAAGKLNDAFSLNGVNSYVQVNGSASISGARSVSMWVYARTSTSALGMPLLTGGAAGAGDFLGILNGQPYIDHWNFPEYRCNLTLTSNAWNHVAMVYDGSTVQFYVNGVAATLVSGNLYNYTVGTYRIGGNTIGGSTTAASFNGLLDEIRLYPRVLTASEVQALAALSTTTTTTPTAPPALSIAKTHSGNFTQGQTNAVYTLTVSNQPGVLPTSGTVSVAENVPTGLTLVSMAGTGWTCPSAGTTCTRVDSLSAGASYPAITVTVNVASNAPATVTNAVTVSGGGDSSTHIATDPTTIVGPETAPPGALSYWPADDTTIDIISGNNGTLVNGATYAAGKLNDAFSLNGVNSYVQVNGGASISGARSISMWVYARTSASTLGMPLLTGGVAGAGDFLGILNGQPYIDHWNFPEYRCNLALTSNAWNHVAMTYDGSTVQFYVNGVAATPVSGNLYDYTVGTYRIGGNTIGGSTTAASFNGLLDEIRLYPRVLTASEVQVLAGMP